jgi:hypothetical protein
MRILGAWQRNSKARGLLVAERRQPLASGNQGSARRHGHPGAGFSKMLTAAQHIDGATA